MWTMKTAIEFNCCTGQVSLALKSHGYRILAAVDIDEVALEAHLKNFPDTRVYQQDLSKPIAYQNLKFFLGRGFNSPDVD